MKIVKKILSQLQILYEIIKKEILNKKFKIISNKTHLIFNFLNLINQITNYEMNKIL